MVNVEKKNGEIVECNELISDIRGTSFTCTQNNFGRGQNREEVIRGNEISSIF